MSVAKPVPLTFVTEDETVHDHATATADVMPDGMVLLHVEQNRHGTWPARLATGVLTPDRARALSRELLAAANDADGQVAQGREAVRRAIQDAAPTPLSSVRQAFAKAKRRPS